MKQSFAGKTRPAKNLLFADFNRVKDEVYDNFMHKKGIKSPNNFDTILPHIIATAEPSLEISNNPIINAHMPG